MQGSTVHEWEELADGRFRFAILWPNTSQNDNIDDDHHHTSGSLVNRLEREEEEYDNMQPHQHPHHKVILEARSKEVGQTWMQALETERFDYYKANYQRTTQALAASQARITELERQVANYKLVESDREDALQDAAHWKDQFVKLDEALRRLTQELQKPVDSTPIAGTTSASLSGEPKTPAKQPRRETDHDDHDGTEFGHEDEKKSDDHPEVEDKQDNAESASGTTGDAVDKSLPKSVDPPADGDDGARKNLNLSRDSSLLDEALEVDGHFDVMAVPGTYFSGLYNTCAQLRENQRLASVEASTALDDLQAANARVEAVDKRMAKAENHLCKLWEENCSIRKMLKLKKREKRVLVREVKNLRQALDKTQQQQPQQSGVRGSQQNGRGSNVKGNDISAAGADDDDASAVGSDEEKLIHELEEHLMVSIRLHEQMLGGSGEKKNGLKQATSELLETSFESQQSDLHANGPTVRLSAKSGEETNRSSKTIARGRSARPGAVASLLDNNSDDDGSEDEADPLVPSTMSISSMDVEVEDEREELHDHSVDNESNYVDSPDRIKEQAPNPLLHLDDDEYPPQLCATSSQSESSKSNITTTGQATNKLVCPLADVIETKKTGIINFSDIEHDVYHLTFYSRKIGIQFQKVPPPPSRRRGLLTDAMTADIAGVSVGSSKTAAELRRIAAITTRAKPEIQDTETDVCDVATPVDAVLVCGFSGFDDSGTNVRPKLGARLVAFDGVSVEIGRWTFDSIRKAIQARERPLTLSFRNDFLTTEQRAILTKAVKDMERWQIPRRTTPNFHRGRRPSLEPSVHSVLSSEPDHIVNETRTYRSNDDDSSVSVAYSDHNQSMPQSFSASRSVSSSQGNFRSFSEAGSSVSVLSAVAPLVANLLARRDSEQFSPQYLRRSESVENTPQHQDFKAELL